MGRKMFFLKKQKLCKNNEIILIYLCWLVYSISYLGKVNYSANINSIIEFYNISKAEAGTPTTLLFFAYGIGQVVNGIFCKKYNIKWMIFTSIMASAAINLFVGITTNFFVIKLMWMLNGFLLSILWPALVRLLAESLPKKELSRSSAIMGTCVATGTLAIYALSSLYSSFNKFKLAFYTAAFAGIAIAVFWLFLYNKATTIVKDENHNECCETDVAADTPEKPTKPKYREKLFLISIYVLCFCAIGVNLIKDGLISWLPAILKEEYSVNDSISILLTIFLPIVSVFGNLLALRVHKKIPDFVMHCTIDFATMFVLMWIIIGGLNLKSITITLGGLIVVSLLASSLNSLITSIFPIFMREKVNSGMCAGILNGFCYLGSTISAYGLGVIADNFGWKMMFWSLMLFCIVICFVCCGYIFFKQRRK